MDRRLSVFVGLAMVVLVCVAASPLRAADAKTLLDVNSPGIEGQFAPQSGSESQVKVTRSSDPAAPGMVVTVQPGQAGYPGMHFTQPGGTPWDLSAYGHVEAKVVNTGAEPMLIAVRVDNAGDWRASPWNCEQTYLKPGQAGTVTVIFGYQYGHKKGYALDPKAISGILFFTTKSKAVQSFRIESIVAGGPAGEKPPVDPNSILIEPDKGVVFGPGMPKEVAVVVAGQGGVSGKVSDDMATLHFPEKGGGALLRPEHGRWNWRSATEIRVKLKNTGATPITPAVELPGGNTVHADAPLAAGAETELVVPFAADVPFKGIPNPPKPGFYGGMRGTGTSFTSNNVANLKISAEHTGAAELQVESVIADAPPADMPDWIGKRPPVEGQWVQTFDEDFNGPTIDPSKWNIYGPNYYDQMSHWSKDNLILGDGLLRIRYEKKRGLQDDGHDPTAPPSARPRETEYASGYLDTLGHWTQRYGYFEARMKLPAAPGLWPAFWMMPDREPMTGPAWKRQFTDKTGMEMDIMEHLTRWGTHRYNIAVHFEGYGKDHKSIGSACNYVQTDKDGFITAGLLWLPGHLTWYCNGKEVAEWDDPRVSDVQSDLMFTMPAGGWDNDPIDDATLPSDFVIDYVRCWQRKDLATPPPTANSAAPAQQTTPSPK